MSTLGKKAALSLSLLLLWVCLTGRLDSSFIAAGTVISLFVVRVVWGTFFSGFHGDPVGARGWSGIRIFSLLCFIPCFFLDLVKSTWDVSMIALMPKISLAPAIVEVQSHLSSKTALIFLANQVTLTPGTLTLDADMANHRLFIHVLSLGADGPRPVRDQISQLESRIEAIKI